MVHFNNITATYSPNFGIRNFSLRVNKGDMVSCICNKKRIYCKDWDFDVFENICIYTSCY